MLYPTTTTNNEKKLFDNKKIFNEFEFITQERKKEIDILVKKYKQGKIFKDKHNYLLTENYCVYAKTLEYLVNNNNGQLISLDEEVLFLINSVDSNCEMYEIYLSCPNDLTNKNKESIIRNKLGFFSPYLLKYEYYYMNKFNQILLTNVNKDYSKNFVILAPMVKNFDEITDERFEQIQERVELYKEIPNISLTYQTCIYNILYQANILELNSMQEKLIFFINVIDPELTLLKIYSEESINNSIKQRAIDELGFFYKCLIKIELLYYKRFCPNKKISDWSL